MTRCVVPVRFVSRDPGSGTRVYDRFFFVDWRQKTALRMER